MTHELPERFVDRWRGRPDLEPDQGTVYWHLLVGAKTEVRATAAAARAALSALPGLHFTPERWLHVTVLVAGSTARLEPAHLAVMAGAARGLLANVAPITVNLGQVLYHPEAIALRVRPGRALLPVRDAAWSATLAAGGRPAPADADPWVPHVTVAYSTTDRPARPAIGALGLHTGPVRFVVDALSLVVQRGAERAWDWQVVQTISLGGASHRREQSP